MVQVPRYRPSTGAPSPGGAYLRPPPAVAPPNTGSVSRGFGGLERGAAQLERGANRLRAGGESVARGAEAAANAADRLAGAQGDVTRAVLGVAATMGQFYERQAERDAKDLLTELIEKRTNREIEYLAKSGQDAVDAYEPAIEGFKQDYEEIAAKARNPLSRRMLDEQANLQRIEYEANVGRHSIGENKAADLDSSTALQEGYKRQAVLNYTDKQLLQKNFALIDMESDVQGEILGWTPEVLAFEKIKAKTTVHKQIMRRMVDDGKLDLAAEYLEDFTSEMLADDVISSSARLTAAVEEIKKTEHAALLKQQQVEMADLEQRVETAARALRRGYDVSNAEVTGLLSEIAYRDGRVDPEDEETPRKLAGFNARLIRARDDKKELKRFNGLPYNEQAAFLMKEEHRIRNDQGMSVDARLRADDLLSLRRKSYQETTTAIKDGTLIDLLVLRGDLPMGDAGDIDIGKPGDLNADAVANRRVAKRMLEDSFGYRNVRLMSNAQADVISGAILGKDGSDLNEGLEVVSDLVFKFGEDDAKGILAQSLDTYSNALMAGYLLTEGNLTTGRMVLDGARKLSDPETRNNVPKLSDTDRDEEYRDLKKELEVDSSLGGLVDPIFAAADACFATTTAGKGDVKVYEDCIKQVSGGFVDHDGQKNLAPVHGMGQAQFDDLVGDLTAADFLKYGNGTPMLGSDPMMPEDLVRGAFEEKTVLVSLGAGQYYFHQPDPGGIVRTEKGEPYVIDLKRFHKDGSVLFAPPATPGQPATEDATP